MFFQPGQGKVFRPGAFRGVLVEIGVVQEGFQECAVALSGAGPVAISIVRLALMAGNPGVEQGITRAGIEARDRLAVSSLGQEGDIGDSPKVEHRPVFFIRLKYRLVKGRYQGRSLAASGDVPAAEIGDGGNAGDFGYPVGVADLKRVGMMGVGVVVQSLPVTADGDDIFGGDAGLFEQFKHAMAVQFSQFGIQLAQGG